MRQTCSRPVRVCVCLTPLLPTVPVNEMFASTYLTFSFWSNPYILSQSLWWGQRRGRVWHKCSTSWRAIDCYIMMYVYMCSCMQIVCCVVINSRTNVTVLEFPELPVIEPYQDPNWANVASDRGSPSGLFKGNNSNSYKWQCGYGKNMSFYVSGSWIKMLY